MWQGQNADEIIDFDAQLNVVALIAQPAEVDAVTAFMIVQRVLQCQGQIFAFVKLSGFEEGTMRGIVEYCDSSAAAAAISTCNGAIFDVSLPEMCGFVLNFKSDRIPGRPYLRFSD